MRITLDIRKTLAQNADAYFSQAKKSRAKITGAKKAIERAKALPKKEIVASSKQVPVKMRKKAWYERFKWFYTSEGQLVIAGRSAKNNEMILKKYTESHDIIFHTEVPSSPFVILKTEGKKPTEHCLLEAADFCASHASAWKKGVSADVYWVTPDQVTKTANTGEYLATGSFVVRGERHFVVSEQKLVAIPFKDHVMIAPRRAVKDDVSSAALITIGDLKKSDAAKKIRNIIGCGEIDEIVAALPTGGCTIQSMN